MAAFKMDIGEIGDLARPIAGNGSISISDGYGDGMFEYMVAIAVLIYEMYPY